MNRTNIAVAAAAAMLLAGCSGGTGSGVGEFTGPLEPFLGYSPLADEMWPGGGMGLQNMADIEELSEDEDKMRKVERLTAGCMRAKGFEYVPYLPDASVSKFDQALALPPEEFARQYGYGESTLVPYMWTDMGTDPNELIRDELSPRTRRAYDRALYGDPPVDGAGAVGAAPSCYGKASRVVFGDVQAPVRSFDGLLTEAHNLRQRLARDPEMVGVTRQWSGCMAARGFGGLHQLGDGKSRVAAKIEQAKPAGREHAEATPEDVDARLQAFERKIATADFECLREHVQPVASEVATRLERQFIDDHQAELEQYREYLAAIGTDR